MKQMNEKLKKGGKKALAGAAGIVAVCSMAVGSLASTPDELFSGIPQSTPIAVSQSVGDSRSIRQSKDTASKKQSRLHSWLRSVFFSQPSVVRGIVLLPFWTVGKALLSVLSLLFTALSPFLQVILGILLNALLLFGLFAVILKLLFPNLRLRDLFTKRNILILIISSIVLAIADVVLRATWEDYRPISILIKLGMGVVILALLSYRIFGKRKPAQTNAFT